MVIYPKLAVVSEFPFASIAVALVVAEADAVMVHVDSSPGAIETLWLPSR
jgi:hypothetical protein